MNVTYSEQFLVGAKLYLLLCILDFQSTDDGKGEAGSRVNFSPS